MGRYRARKADSFKRKKPDRKPQALVLIVCEGEKTERQYLRELCNDLWLSAASVTITPSHLGSDPMSVVTYAIDRHKAEDEIYDRVYCVFDRDTHANYDQALTRLNDSPFAKKGILHAITSVPCFEIWVLLHFAYSTASFVAGGGKSPCDKVVEAIHPHFGGYAKGPAGLYQHLKPMTNQALTYAGQLTKHNHDSGSNNPATKVHDLVRYLKSLADELGA